MDDHSVPPQPRAHATVLAAVLLIAGVSFIANFTAVSSNDVWYHLSLGRAMSQSGEIPRTNLLSYTAPDHPVPPLSWLFQWSIYHAHETFGTHGVVAVRASAVAGALAFLFLTMARDGVGTLTGLVVTALAACAAWSRFVDRPHVPALLILAVQIWLYESWLRAPSGNGAGAGDGRANLARRALPILALQVLWANIHGSAVLGVVLPGVHLMGGTLERILGRTTPCRRNLGIPAAMVVASFAVSGVNPDSWGLLVYPFTHAHSFEATGTRELFTERAHVTLGELGGPLAFFGLFLLVALVALAAGWRQARLADLGFLVPLGVAIYSARFIGEAVVFAAPVTARLLSAACGRWHVGPWLSERLRWRTGALAFAGLIAVASFRDGRPWGGTVSPRIHPVDAVRFLNNAGSAGRIYNDFEFGGFLAWHGYPIFMDSRGPGFYPGSLFEKYLRVRFDPDIEVARKALDELEQEHGFTLAVVRGPQTIRLFRERRTWQMLYVGPVGSVFAKGP